MRVRSLHLSGFRAFTQPQDFDLDADAVIIVGANGQGKSSLFDGILWSLAGSIPRLGSDASIVSLFSSSGEARAEVSLANGRSEEVAVRRSFDGTSASLLLESGNEAPLRGPEAHARLLRLLWPQALAAADSDKALISALQRGVYLEQDLVRAFIEAESDQERFSTISELVGAGRVTELQSALERSRLAWSRATNTRTSDLEALRNRIETLQGQLQSMLGDNSEAVIDSEEWAEWWSAVADLGITIARVPTPDSAEVATALDSAVKELRARQLANDRELQTFREALSQIQALPPRSTEDIEALRDTATNHRVELDAARARLAEAQEKAAGVRRQQVERQEAREEMRVFAELALRHLSEHCPVCQQTYDRESARERLERFSLGGDGTTEPTEEVPDIGPLAQKLEELEQAYALSSEQLRGAEERAREWQVSYDGVLRTMEFIELASEPEDEWQGKLEARISHLDRLSRQLVRLHHQGERLSLAVARAGQDARQAEIQRELASLERDAQEVSEDVHKRQRTGELVTKMLEALRGATSDVVEEQLLEIEPLLQRIYASADPHPAFRVARLLTRMSRGRGRLMPGIDDPVSGVSSSSPTAVLSSSQMNVLAVSLFLSLSIGLPALPLQTAILDDPLQSLDDLNLLGLIDLLRRARERRQLLISTHDHRFASLLERKLRPVAPGQRTLVIELDGWSRNGPTVHLREVPPEAAPVRIAS